MPTLEEIKKEYENLLQQLSNPGLISDLDKLEEFSRRKNFLEKIIDKNQELQATKTRITENTEILTSGEDAELASLASAEIVVLREKESSLEQEIEDLLKGEKKSEPQAVIVEIRAGTGGEEASLFAADLFKMYSKHASISGWQQKILDSHPTEIGGFKEIIFELTPSGPKNADVWSSMKYEGGVHRVQRIPETEKTGRIHTSTASVAILPKPKSTQIPIRPDELKIEFYKSSGPGGQNVNKRETAVRIVHIPTGIVVTSQTERSQADNRANALTILSAKILEKKERESEEMLKGKRKTQIGWAKRAEKVRTYNFPQDRVTDHRIKKSWHNIEKIMNGGLELLISALKRSELA